MNYYISDLHIGHENVICFDDRPFKDIDEMFNELVTRWNNVVTDKDTVYILGDFIWYKENMWEDVVKQFNGHKVLVKGNHDVKSMSSGTRKLFDNVVDYCETTDNGRRVIMSHYPILFYRADYNPNVYMLYGHVHNTKEMDYLQQFRKILVDNIMTTSSPLAQILHVGCMEEYMNYTPRTLDEIIEGDKKKYLLQGEKQNGIDYQTE